MYGLEKGKLKKFNFDLEAEIKKNPKKAKEIIDKAKNNGSEIKTTLRKGGKQKEIDNLGIVLQGYNALEKVINRVGKS